MIRASDDTIAEELMFDVVCPGYDPKFGPYYDPLSLFSPVQHVFVADFGSMPSFVEVIRISLLLVCTMYFTIGRYLSVRSFQILNFVHLS